MEFEFSYTEEQEQFRKEVRAWLGENVREEMKEPTDPDDFTDEQYWYWRDKHKVLAAKGWLFPTYAKEYGGGGLSPEHESILKEEFLDAGIPRFGSDLIIAMLMVWGSEEQKQKFLVPLLNAEKTTWQKFTEPKSGSDLANYQSTAVRDGDDWLLSGSNVFCSGRGDHPDFLWGPMLTDLEAPRHRNLGFFMVPVPNEGLQIINQNLVSGKEQHFIFLDNVRVPGDHLIGDEHQGWQVTNTGLEQEHGGRGQVFPRDEVVDNLVAYMQERRQRGESPGGNPILQQTAVSAYIDAHIDSLFKKRTYWMYQSRMDMSWEGPSQFHYQRLYGFRNVGKVRDVMGMYTMLGTRDPLAPHGGAQEVDQRTSFIHQHGAGSFNITKVVLARRIGISRTKERAAPTPMTATTSGA